MSKEIIAKAEYIINAKAEFAGGFDAYATLTLIDENGYPTSSTLSIVKADGIKWLTFISGIDDNPAKRIRKSNRACVCINTNKYHISLVGTVEISNDIETKKDMWQDVFTGYYDGPNDPYLCVLRFHTEHYNLYFIDGDLEAKGTLY